MLARRLRMLCLVPLLTLLGAGANACAPAAPEGPAAIAFRGVDVVDAVSGLRVAMTVVVEGDRITAVGPVEETPIPARAMEIDGAGATLIPGLWDAHVHFAYEPEVAPAMLPLFVANGITAVRDTGGHVDQVLPWRGLSTSADVPAPRVFVAGPLIDGVPRVYDGGAPFRPDLSVQVTTPQQGSAMVDQLAAAGVDLIKAYEMLDPATFEAVVARAAELGLPTTGHVPLGVEAEVAAHGLRSMEHLRNLEMACAAEADSLLQERRRLLANPAGLEGGPLRSAIHGAQRSAAVRGLDPERCAALIEALVASGGWQVPTLTIVTPRVVRLHATAEWRETFGYLPEPARSAWREGALAQAEMEPDDDARAYAEWAFGMVGDLAAAGVPIMAGTDTPIYFLTPGFSLHEELALLVRAGMTPLQALGAATLEPARYFGLDDQMGSVQVGNVADLVLLDASPLDEIRNTRRIRAVVSRGRLYRRADLDGMLAGLERGETVAPILATTERVGSEISMPPRPDWCDDLPRSAYAGLDRVAVPGDWFEVYAIREGVFAIYEPHQWQEVISYLIVGSDRALLWDTGMGIGDLAEVAGSLTDLPVVVVNSHSHYDHVGGNADFEQVWGFGLEYTADNATGTPHNEIRGEVAPEALCRQLPAGVAADTFIGRPYRITRRLEDGEVIDLGGRVLEVLATPGHTPDAAVLLDRDAGLLFTGDSFYEGPIWLFAPETDLPAYRRSMARLAELVPDLKLLLPAHNTPVSPPRMLLRLNAALAAIEAGEVRGEAGERATAYAFEGFSLLIGDEGRLR